MAAAFEDPDEEEKERKHQIDRATALIGQQAVQKFQKGRLEAAVMKAEAERNGEEVGFQILQTEYRSELVNLV